MTSYKCDMCEETCIANKLYKMLLFKYLEKRARDGLPDPNGPLFACVPSKDNVCQPTERYPGACRISAEPAASEGKKHGP